MIEITKEDLEIIASHMDVCLGEAGGYADEIDEILDSNEGDIMESLWDLVGSYLHGMPHHVASEKMSEFIFESDASDLTPYLYPQEGQLYWKTVIARWRLQTRSFKVSTV